MKKVLIASTALVAATMLSAGAASASEKIKLNLGGYSKWWVVAAQQDSSFQANANTAGAQADYNTVDIKGDNEIFFGGSTTLDNGLKVGIDIQLEAGGHTDQTTDTIDESYIWIEGGFGKFIVGSENNGTYLLHVTAPDAAGNWNEGGIMTGGFSLAVPTNVRGVDPTSNGNNTTAIVTDNDAEKITYVAPSFYGLTVGASYVPSAAGQDNRSTVDINTQTTGEIFGAGALYANTFGGVGVKVSAGAVFYDLNSKTVGGAKDDVQEYAAGTQLSYAGFTLGGSYRQVVASTGTTTLDNNASAWDIGLQYASGPYAVSAAYFKSSAEGTRATVGEDEIEFYQVSGKYTLGAGVDALASVGYASYEDETNSVQNENKGWVVMTGLSLAF
ncbi:MAG: porin [Rhodospirillaceae bacterium]|nr:porin [Rhodospirillales bacterium]